MPIINFIIFAINLCLLKKFLHVYQLRNYNNRRYFKFFTKKHVFFLIFACFLCVLFIFIKNLYLYIVSSALLTSIHFWLNFNLVQNKKTPISFTPRLKRIFAISISLLVIYLILCIPVIVQICLLYLTPTIANSLNFYDHFINRKFISLASKKLKQSNIKIIAITGSNGKTSVKNILHSFLESTYIVQSTPSSFNTPIGIAKFINQELKDSTEILILEYGARRKNDIKILCKIYGANFGILTSISPQHMETFKSVENIKNAKNELPKYLQENLCVFNVDNSFCLELFNKKTGEKLSVSTKQQGVDFFASNIRIENFKTKFTIHFNNTSYDAETHLLGEHNVYNILMAFAIAINLNIKPEIIVDSIAKLKAIKHRLELIKTHIIILDDTYNCSLDSAKQALKVLHQFPNKKMIVTPGIIEGGKVQKNINFELGKMIAFCDYVIIVGTHNKESIFKGLLFKNFNLKNLIFVPTLEEAKPHFSLLSNNDTLLFLNDLPDDFK